MPPQEQPQPSQPHQQDNTSEVTAALAEIRQFKREISDNLAKSEEILGLAQSKLLAANALLKRAAEERDKIQTDRAEVLKIGRGLKIKEERLKQREEALNLGTPFGSPYPDIVTPSQNPNTRL
jgi:hypothetical protein